MPCTVHLPFLFFIILSSVPLLSLSSFFPLFFFLCSVPLLSPVAVKLFFPFFFLSRYIYIYIFVLDLINNTCIATMNVATSFFLSQ
jgi:hypothetical protein